MQKKTDGCNKNKFSPKAFASKLKLRNVYQKMGRHRDLNPGSRESESRKLTTPTHRPEFPFFLSHLYHLIAKKISNKFPFLDLVKTRHIYEEVCLDYDPMLK